MTVYGAGPPPRKPRKRRRGWVRVALWSTGTILLVVIAVAAAGIYLFYGDYSRITTPPKDFRNAEPSIDPTLPIANAPAIALVIGSDHRYTDGSAPARSDTLMLVRIDPRTHLISLLSLPRDLWVDIPGYGQDKINAAYSDGGPKLALQTVKQVTGLHVNYLIGVNFHSFTSLVNELGGVYIPVDQAYVHTEAENNALPVSERWSAINILPGYQLLNGANALAFSRFRHTDSDFYRTARQQAFLHAFEQKVSARFHGISLTDLGTIKSVIDTIASNVDIAGASGGIGIHTMLNYATLAYSIKGHIISTRLQAGTAMIGAASVVEATPGAMKQAVYAFTHPQNIPSPTGQLPTAPVKHTQKKHKFKPAVAPATVSLSVLNGTLKTGVAATTGAAAGQVRLHHLVRQRAHSVLQPDVGLLRLGPRPGRGRRRPHHRPQPPDGAACRRRSRSAEDVVVVLGSDFSGKLAVAPPKSGHSSALPADITPDSQAYLTEFRSVTHHVTFPVLYPTVTQEASNVPSLYPIRAYHIPAEGRHWSSLYAYFELPEHARRQLGDRGDALRRRAHPGQPERGAADRRAHLPVLFQRGEDPHDRVRRARHGLLGAEHAPGRPLERRHDRDLQVARAGRMSQTGDTQPVGVIGVGYVGLVTAVCFADLGHEVVCLDVNEARIEALRAGKVPIYEPGVDRLLARNRSRLRFTLDLGEVVDRCRIVFVCVDTPATYSGDADLSRVPRRGRRAAADGRAVRARHEEHRPGRHRREGARGHGRARPRPPRLRGQPRVPARGARPSPTSWSPTGS